MSAAPRSVYFVSLGCPKNRVDSEVMLGSLAGAGHVLVESPDEAEVIVVNTCGFIDAAKEESIDTILEMAQYKESGSCRKLVVTGCLTQRYPDEVAREIPEIDHILGSADFAGIADVVADAPAGARGARRGRRVLPVVEVSETPAYLYDHTAPRLITGPRFSVYVKIAEGCDRPCSFCIIPKLRGPQRSRSIDSVATEVERLVAEGAREVNLVAQDLTRYGADLADRPTLAQLLARLARIADLRWIRMHYTYPSAWSDELIDVVAGEPKVVKYVDVPLQHIDEQMLKIMRRGHSARVTGALLERLRARIPGLVLRSTFIVGHPGETDEAFESLCRFVEAEELDRVGVFTYSREAGTVSALLPHRVPASVAIERRDRLMEIQRGISRRKNQALIGRDIEVLVEGVSDESELLLQGRWYGQAPEIDGSVYLADGSAAPGQLVRARVTDGSDYDLAASLSS
ncbi:MAG TPA: 30S ribosomal protein S12 methylthiotransferase RimO [Kofleriaceae bacterium]|nr:30S ribosomal protein S12 methylthiotransferase RimO [Kofleriaceae bacterium]